MSTHVLEHHQYDLLMNHKNPLSLRLNDAQHQQIKIGDIIEIGGHNNIMDRQRFKVVNKMNHPSIHSAMQQIDHSGLDIRDKIKMTEGFMETHGSAATQHGVTSLQLAPHPMPNGGTATASTGSLKYL